MKEDILNLLLSTNSYISGEDISNILGVTRSCIWKHIKSLKNDGYIIDGVSNKGYKLISSPIDLSLPELKNLLSCTNFSNKIIFFDEIDSTNLHAKKLASTGSPEGTVVVSKIQNNGVGRLQREWVSPTGGLWFSLILKPPTTPINAGKIPLIAAASIYNTLSKLGYPCKIKWPNDILLNSKKVCGILTEMNCELDKINYVILGIGVNVNIKSIPKLLEDKATSMFLSN
ncbi:MAG: biotin--[acetyl-CoA-carboxylase] ligase, partial [Clostridium sp.]